MSLLQAPLTRGFLSSKRRKIVISSPLLLERILLGSRRQSKREAIMYPVECSALNEVVVAVVVGLVSFILYSIFNKNSHTI